MTPDSLRILLAGLVDYAGLFPPSALTMPEVVANYASYRGSPDAWALGRLIVPVGRLSELSASGESSEHVPNGWRVSALASDDMARDADCIARWNVACEGALVADTIELRASTSQSIVTAAKTFADAFTVYVEVPVDDDPGHLIAEIARAGLRAKIRTGGVASEAFPAAAQIVRFLRRCIEHDVAFKATAGLHHPLCGNYPLTYAHDAPTGKMFGFVNVFLAAAFMRMGLSDHGVTSLLEEDDPASFHFTRESVRWRDEVLNTQRLAECRTSFAIAFGSCSFREPIDDLHRLGLL
jgi:hypothetical protein